MKIKSLFFALALICIVQVHAQSYGAPYSSIECIDVELDGSITVRVSGHGRNDIDAAEQAKKNAVYNVIFKGVKVEGSNSAISRPLILEVNAEEKYQEFTNIFFADSGEYSKFVSMADRRWFTSKSKKSKKGKTWTTTVRVLRPELQKYLKERNIIKTK
ncbi:MAG: hypothetical protein K2O58_01685 [Bacteroidales bacterium]|nr:hypothetical protein [Bacteroidales bacterium]MDE7126596.1 hypothetical protein [Bacteroidales bacterium]